MSSETGKWLIVAGVFLLLAGIAIYFFHDKLHWIGRLPGDIRIEKGNTRFYFPITTILLFSALFSLILQIIKKLF